MRKKLASLCVAGALFSTSALAQEDEAMRYDRALAAGYKAQFICSGLWNGGKSLADIKADELTGIYDRVAEIVPTLAEEAVSYPQFRAHQTVLDTLSRFPLVHKKNDIR